MFANYLWFKKEELRPIRSVNGHSVMQSETSWHRSLTAHPTLNFDKYANHQGTYTIRAFIQSLILITSALSIERRNYHPKLDM
jgi:hypothetical protein